MAPVAGPLPEQPLHHAEREFEAQVEEADRFAGRPGPEEKGGGWRAERVGELAEEERLGGHHLHVNRLAELLGEEPAQPLGRVGVDDLQPPQGGGADPGRPDETVGPGVVHDPRRGRSAPGREQAVDRPLVEKLAVEAHWTTNCGR